MNETERLTALLELHQRGIREAYKLLAKAQGGCVAKAKTELARFLSEEELAAFKVNRKPCG